MLGETVESWKERLSEIVQGYEKEDVWSMDETESSVHYLIMDLVRKVGVVRKTKRANSNLQLHFCVCIWSERKARGDLEI